jgi:hypothetical protein
LLSIPFSSNFASAQTLSSAKSATAAQCPVRVVANDTVVSTTEWFDVGHHVLPAGVVENPNAWPYFAWSDTPLGVTPTLDGSGYLFFGSDGGDHPFDGSLTDRAGAITVSQGTLDHPLGEPLDDPNPAPREFLMPTSGNLPPSVDYVGGGPVYRVPAGEPGAGSLLIVYHVERNANPFWSWLGIAKSTDEGMTWQDLGLVISGPQPYTADGASDVGDGNLMVATDPATLQKFFYIYFPQHCWVTGTATCNDFTYLSVARAPYEQLLLAAMNATENSFPVRGMFHKRYQGAWNEPGIDGKADELFPGVTGETDGDPQVVWSAYRNRFVAIMDNGQNIAYGESVDGLLFPPMQVVAGTSTQIPVYAYANAVGADGDPAILGKTFYSYYTVFPSGASWSPAEIKRLTLTSDCDSAE